MSILDTVLRLSLAAIRSPAGQSATNYILRQGTAALVRAVQKRSRDFRKSGKISYS